MATSHYSAILEHRNQSAAGKFTLAVLFDLSSIKTISISRKKKKIFFESDNLNSVRIFRRTYCPNFYRAAYSSRYVHPSITGYHTRMTFLFTFWKCSFFQCKYLPNLLDLGVVHLLDESVKTLSQKRRLFSIYQWRLPKVTDTVRPWHLYWPLQIL